MAKYKIKDSVIGVFIKNRHFTKKDNFIFDDINGTDIEVVNAYKAGHFEKIEEPVKTESPVVKVKKPKTKK